MTFLNHKYGRYLAALPLVVIIAIAAYFKFATGTIEDILLREKYQEKRNQIDTLCEALDSILLDDNDWGLYPYENVINRVINQIDTLPMTFAAAYTWSGGEWQLISEREPSYGTPFDPTISSEFCYTAMRQECGDIIVPFQPHGEKPRDMWLYFKWLPSNQDLDDRVLVTVAISKYSINTPINALVSAGVWAAIFLVLASQIYLLILIIKLGYIYDCRTGDSKWRSKRD